MLRLPFLTVLIIVGSFLPCAGQDVEFPEVDGWSRVGEVRVYTADNLWEYINGAAELFVEYDVLTCHTGDITAGGLLATVDLYEMSTPLNAFGVFSRERPEAGMRLPGAAEAVVSPPYQALLLKGSTYVKVNAVEGEFTLENGRDLLEAIANALPGQAGYPEELELLPPAGKVDGSEGYERIGYLGLTELQNCLYADYTDEQGRIWEGFIVLPLGGSSSESIWNALAGRWSDLAHRGGTILYREIPYRGLVGVVRLSDAVVGASGAADRAELLAWLERFYP